MARISGINAVPTTLLGVVVSTCVMLAMELVAHAECRKHAGASECATLLAVGIAFVLAVAVYLLVNLSR